MAVRIALDQFFVAVNAQARTGGYICLGQFLHAFLVGKKNLGSFKNPYVLVRYTSLLESVIKRLVPCSGFQSTMRANPLAQKILASVISLGLNDTISFYTPDNCRHPFHILSLTSASSGTDANGDSGGAFLNDTAMPLNHNYMTPTTARTINGQQFTESQRFAVGLSALLPRND